MPSNRGQSDLPTIHPKNKQTNKQTNKNKEWAQLFSLFCLFWTQFSFHLVTHLNQSSGEKTEYSCQETNLPFILVRFYKQQKGVKNNAHSPLLWCRSNNCSRGGVILSVLSLLLPRVAFRNIFMGSPCSWPNRSNSNTHNASLMNLRSKTIGKREINFIEKLILCCLFFVEWGDTCHQQELKHGPIMLVDNFCSRDICSHTYPIHRRVDERGRREELKMIAQQRPQKKKKEASKHYSRSSSACNNIVAESSLRVEIFSCLKKRH
jgi:hypothetical protein